MKRLIILLVPIVLFSTPGFTIERDSLWEVWSNKELPDSVRFPAIYNLTWNGYLFIDPDSAYHLAEIQLNYARKRNNLKWLANALTTQGVSFAIRGMADSGMVRYSESLKYLEQTQDYEGLAGTYNNIGILHWQQGKLKEASIALEKSKSYHEKVKNSKGVASALVNLGLIYKDRGNHVQAIKNYKHALSIAEQFEDDNLKARIFNNVGIIYMEQADTSSAWSNYSQSLKIARANDNKPMIHDVLNNMGTMCSDNGNLDEALSYYLESLEIRKSIGDQNAMLVSLINIGNIHLKRNENHESLKYFNDALRMAEAIDNKRGISNALNGLGTANAQMGQTQTAIRYSQQALIIAQNIGLAMEIEAASNMLYDLYKEMGNYSRALEMYELHIATRDSTKSEENQREVLRQEYKYEYEKEALADSLVFAKKEALSQAEIKRKNQQRNALMGGLGLITIFSGLLYNRFRVTRKQKKVIEVQKAEVEAQKEQVEHKNEEIMASITYAKKLQTAVLPPARVVKEFFANSFLLYLPRDIVSGDFYWMESKGDVSYFAVADCTGHGVPGAMLSVIGMNGLNRALNEQKLTEPKDILTSLSDHVQRHFEQSESTVRDGMDICLCALNNKTKKLTFSGANNPVWIARNGEMHILNGDRRAIGHHNTDTKFTQQEFQLQDGDVIYLSSDGYQDQLGGPKTRKLMKKVFREKLLALSTKPLETQRETLLSDLELWQQDTPQTDDICVMGIRV